MNRIIENPVSKTTAAFRTLPKPELNTILILLVGLILLIITRFLHQSFYFIYNPSHFLAIHSSLELVGIVLSLSLSLYGFLVFPHSLSKHRLYISSFFLAVGCIDLFHTLSYFGMPRFITENSYQKPTWFWLIARFTEYISFIFVFSLKDQIISLKKRRIFLILPLLYSIIVCSVIVLFEKNLPILVDPEIGVTLFKRVIEYVNSFLILIILMIIFKKYKNEKDTKLLYLVIAFIYLFMTQMIFTLYRNVFDLDNFLGHIFKIIGSYYLLKGLYISMIEEPYEKKLAAEESLKIYQKQLMNRILEVQEEERKHLSRELHDRVGQALYSISIGLKLFEIEKEKNDPLIGQKLKNVQKMLDYSMDEVKNIAIQLRPSALDHLGLIPTIKTFIDHYQSLYGISVKLNLEGPFHRHDIHIETALYRVCIEAMNNSAKHSCTKEIFIDIKEIDSGIYMKIEDFGQGFDLDSMSHQHKGIGLYSMKERIANIQGKINISSEIGKGTTIEVWSSELG